MMKTRNLIGMIAFCLFALAACTPSKESGKTLTVLSWNVWAWRSFKNLPRKGM
jgi:outer membrane protein assembly factor BamE (lipoprotein component of BamABCDE complex)